MNVCLKFETTIEVSVPIKHWLKERVDLCFNIKKVERLRETSVVPLQKLSLFNLPHLCWHLL